MPGKKLGATKFEPIGGYDADDFFDDDADLWQDDTSDLDELLESGDLDSSYGVGINKHSSSSSSKWNSNSYSQMNGYQNGGGRAGRSASSYNQGNNEREVSYRNKIFRWVAVICIIIGLLVLPIGKVDFDEDNKYNAVDEEGHNENNSDMHVVIADDDGFVSKNQDDNPSHAKSHVSHDANNDLSNNSYNSEIDSDNDDDNNQDDIDSEEDDDNHDLGDDNANNTDDDSVEEDDDDTVENADKNEKVEITLAPTQKATVAITPRPTTKAITSDEDSSNYNNFNQTKNESQDDDWDEDDDDDDLDGEEDDEYLEDNSNNNSDNSNVDQDHQQNEEVATPTASPVSVGNRTEQTIIKGQNTVVITAPSGIQDNETLSQIDDGNANGDNEASPQNNDNGDSSK